MTTHIQAMKALHGLSGLGQSTGASCPSLEQLEGIVDLNDPCQSALSTLPLSTNPATYVNPITGTLTTSLPLSTAPAAASTGISMTPILIGGAIFLAVLLMVRPGR